MSETPPNDAALEPLLAHAGWVRGLVRELVHDPERRADVEQETWLAALTRRPEGLRDPKGWLRAVARSVLHQGARAGARRERRERASARPEALPSTAELVSQAELQRKVVRSVLELEEPLRSTLLLTYFRGLSCAEIARGAGLPASTVRNRLARGLAELRARFERELGGPEERRRVFLAWLALWPAPARLAPLLARWVALVLALLTLGIVGARSWHTAANAPELGVAQASTERGPGAPTPAPAAVAPKARREAVAPSRAPAAVGLGGQVLDEAGRPIAEALVTVAAAARFDTEPVSIGVAARTDARGVFVLPPELRARSGLVLVAEHPGHVPERAILARDGTRLVLRAAACLEARVVDASSGAPLAGVRVTCNEYDWLDGAVRATVTDAGGRFAIARVPPGLLSLRLARPGDAYQARRVFLEPPWPCALEIALPAGARVAGRVVDGTTGAPLAGARLVVDFAEVARSAADGTFELGGLEPGEGHHLEAQLEGFGASGRALELGPALDAPLLLPLFRECALEGVVLDERGQTVPFATLALEERMPSTLLAAQPGLPPGVELGSVFSEAHATSADALGRFCLDRLEPWRSFQLVATRPGESRSALAGPFELDAPGRRVQATVAFPRATAVLAGSVRVNGQGVRARIAWSASSSCGEARADEQGAYRLETLEPGRVRFEVAIEERGLQFAEELALAPNTPVRHDFELRLPQSALAGHVRRPDGAPVAGQEVSAFSLVRAGPGARGTSDASGAFRLWVLAEPGEALTLRAHAGVFVATLFPVPAGAEDVELVVRETGHVLVRVLAPAGAPEPTELEASWRAAGTIDFTELPRFALVPLGGGRWRIALPAGSVDLLLRASREDWEPVRFGDLRVGRGAEALLDASFEERKER